MSSMLKAPIPEPLVVHMETIDGDRFANVNSHGTHDSVLYAFGVKSALEYMALLGRTEYIPGSLGENVTLDELDETQVSVGDIFQFGEVRVQATFPRIPCAKVNLRMEHDDGQRLLQEVGRSGVYFRILKPGKIHAHDAVERVEQAPVKYLISEIYSTTVQRKKLSDIEFERAMKNGAFPLEEMEKWRSLRV